MLRAFSYRLHARDDTIRHDSRYTICTWCLHPRQRHHYEFLLSRSLIVSGIIIIIIKFENRCTPILMHCFYCGVLNFQRQQLNLALNTPGAGCFRNGTIIHEFLHALGFYHQQSATERDDYVTIVWENIQAGQLLLSPCLNNSNI